MAQIERIDVHEARRHLDSTNALLVCAYDSDEKFDNNHLAGAISLSEFKSQLSDVSTEQEIIFYCR